MVARNMSMYAYTLTDRHTFVVVTAPLQKRTNKQTNKQTNRDVDEFIRALESSTAFFRSMSSGGVAGKGDGSDGDKDGDDGGFVPFI